MRETRQAQVMEFREEDGRHFADLRIVTYGVPDTYKTSWAPGVFTRSIATGQMPSVFSHDPSRPIGVVTNFRDDGQHLDGTLEYLDFEACADAKLAYESMRKGAIPGVSFAFTRNSEEPDAEHRGVTRITDAEMVEISPVLKNSVPGSRVLAVRSDEQIPVTTAADLITRFASGDIDLAEALNELKNTRTAVSESDPGMTGDKGQPSNMRETPHKYVPTSGDESVCKVCGGQKDIQAHGTRSDDCCTNDDAFDPVELRLDNLARKYGRRDAKKPYGNVDYCDKGYQEDGKYRYPVDTKDRTQAAWSYVNQSDNASKYSSEDLAKVKNCIKSKAKKFGIDISGE